MNHHSLRRILRLYRQLLRQLERKTEKLEELMELANPQKVKLELKEVIDPYELKELIDTYKQQWSVMKEDYEITRKQIKDIKTHVNDLVDIYNLKGLIQ